MSSVLLGALLNQSASPIASPGTSFRLIGWTLRTLALDLLSWTLPWALWIDLRRVQALLLPRSAPLVVSFVQNSSTAGDPHCAEVLPSSVVALGWFLIGRLALLFAFYQVCVQETETETEKKGVLSLARSRTD
jgi:hypothetical protein